MSDNKKIILALSFIAIISTILLSLCAYIGSGKQAKIYNDRYNTNYTASDFFWASEQINQSTNTIKLEQDLPCIK